MTAPDPAVPEGAGGADAAPPERPAPDAAGPAAEGAGAPPAEAAPRPGTDAAARPDGGPAPDTAPAPGAEDADPDPDPAPGHEDADRAPDTDPASDPAPGVEDAGAGPPPPPEEPEHRLSPLTMVTAPISYLKGLIVPMGAAVIAGSYNVNPWLLGSAAVAFAGMLVSGLVTYRTFHYRVGAERFEIRKGLISRSRRTIPLERIRGVDITSTLLHRALGLSVVKIEAAAGGGGSEEGKLDAVSRAEADRLRDLLLRRKAALTAPQGAPAPDGDPTAAQPAEADRPPGEQHPTVAEPAETVYFTMPRTWYLYAVLSLAYLLTPFAAIAAVLGFIGQNLDGLGAMFDPEEAVTAAEEIAQSATIVLVGLLVAAVLLLLVLMPVFAVVSYAITHWGFTLLRRGDSLVAERGLFTRRSVTLEHRRIRGHELADNPLQRTRSAVRLSAIVTGLGDTATRAALLPIGDRATVMGIVDRALAPFTGTLRPHPAAARSRRLFRAIAPWTALAAAAAVWGAYPAAILFAVLALLGIPLGIDRYRSLGHGFDGRLVSVRSGSLSRDQAVVESDAIIGWTWKQSLFQRRAEVANLHLSVGAGAGSYVAVDADFAESVAFASGITGPMVRPFLAEQPPGERTGAP
ncbi:putative membrane protein [Murinocardiopsis flavida]|uniref:Putative membrane protein n=1 Tax=Murinocardiopsis flavida TaxID=645275 RepID=A0A2P8CGV1_9ACTN|nr:PH domain-containing protein [Murinocardiopsis flavida]PSK84215.1 putative membrane protein [Murinocardiopsis flavida]